MKNLMSIFSLATLLILTSCTKEPLLQPENDTPSSLIHDPSGSTMHITSETTIDDDIEYSVASQLQVSKVTFSQFANELQVEFTGNHDFASLVLENDQQLTFLDSQNNEIVLNFTVNSYSANGGMLTVTFAVGGQNLTGLQLKQIQYIIIEDELVG